MMISSSTAKPLRLFLLLSVIPGLLTLMAGLGFFWRTQSFLDRAVPVSGVVVELVERRGGQSGTSYAPVYQFEDDEGETHKAYSTLSSYPPTHAVGDEVDLLYDPENPISARENRFSNLWFMATLFIGLGVFFSLAPLLLLLLVKLLTKPKTPDASVDPG